MLTKEEQVVYKSGLTDEKGEMLFTKIPLDDYLIKVYDEMNEVAVQTEAVSIVEDVTKNTSNVEIVKLIHHSDIVITVFLSISTPLNTAIPSGTFVFLSELKLLNIPLPPFAAPLSLLPLL